MLHLLLISRHRRDTPPYRAISHLIVQTQKIYTTLPCYISSYYPDTEEIYHLTCYISSYCPATEEIYHLPCYISSYCPDTEEINHLVVLYFLFLSGHKRDIPPCRSLSPLITQTQKRYTTLPCYISPYYPDTEEIYHLAVLYLLLLSRHKRDIPSAVLYLLLLPRHRRDIPPAVL